MSQIPLLHVLNLDTVGGVEALYVHFLQKTIQRPEIYNHTIVSGKTIHPMYMNYFSSLGLKKPFHEQYVMGIRLPKILRFITDIRRGMIENIFKNTCRWVFWNRIEESLPPHESMYYEHGASWMATPNPKKEQFLQSMKKIIANSKAAKILLSHLWKIPNDEIIVIENPLRPDISIQTTPKTISKGPIRIGYIGRLIALKAPSLCLYTLKELKSNKVEAVLDIAGDGPERSFLEETAQKLGILDRVRFLGTIDSISSFYDSLDFLMIPSLREPLGLIALEASSRGVPVIGSCVDGLYESVAHNVSGVLLRPSLDFTTHEKQFLSKRYGIPSVVVDPILGTITTPKFLDPAEAAHTIMHIAENREEYLRLSSGGLEHIKKRSSFETYINHLVKELSTPEISFEQDE